MRFLLPALALCALLVGFTLATPASSDFDDVMVPLNLYMQGHATGNGEVMRQAFHPEARILWNQDGAVAQRTAEEFAALFTRGPAPDEADRHRRVVSVDITGDVAVAKLELDYPTAFLTDYMTLLRVDGTWTIIGKSYTRGPARSR